VSDAATAEISRSQIWQWIHQDQHTAEGTAVTREYVEGVVTQVLGEVERSERDRFEDAAEIFREVALSLDFPTFLTTAAYTRHLVSID
ncbi:MAG TPA: malate synthase A, partial [Microbacteriaceae bacterium]|nr:malate synthase A [Microbacteriaceae bacterium]